MSDKRTKVSVDYSPGHPFSRCGLCVHYDGHGGCALVAGTIDPAYWCKLFSRRRKR